jgi:threonine/homoserine/homoserine lactone efflux protein
MSNEMFRLVYAAITQGLIIGFCTATLIGPVNFLAIRRGILGGFQELFMVGLGAAFVDASFAYIVFAGLSKDGIVGALKISIWGISVVFLLYLAYSVFLEIKDDPNATSAVKKQIQFIDYSFVQGFLVAATNPFTLIYWVGMVSTLQLSGNIDLAGGAATSFFSAVLVSELVWFMALGIAVHYSRNLFNRHVLKNITWFFGLLLFGYYLFMAIKVAMNLVHTGGDTALPH